MCKEKMWCCHKNNGCPSFSLSLFAYCLLFYCRYQQQTGEVSYMPLSMNESYMWSLNDSIRLYSITGVLINVNVSHNLVHECFIWEIIYFLDNKLQENCFHCCNIQFSIFQIAFLDNCHDFFSIFSTLNLAKE